MELGMSYLNLVNCSAPRAVFESAICLAVRIVLVTMMEAVEVAAGRVRYSISEGFVGVHNATTLMNGCGITSFKV